MKVKHITLLTVVALVALLFVGGAAAAVPATANDQVSDGSADSVTVSTLSVSAKDKDAAKETTLTTATVTGTTDKQSELESGQKKIAEARAVSFEDRNSGYEQIKASMAKVSTSGSSKKTIADIIAASKAKAATYTTAARNNDQVTPDTAKANAAAPVETSKTTVTVSNTDRNNNQGTVTVAGTKITSDKVIVDGKLYSKVEKTTALTNADDTIVIDGVTFAKAATTTQANDADAKTATITTSNAGKALKINDVTYEKAVTTTTVSNADDSIVFNGVTYTKALSNDASGAAQVTAKIDTVKKSVSTDADRTTGYKQMMESMKNMKAASATTKVANAANA